ncbi:uncharacterized protein LTR77_005336 [Saxophila tyrrhenica]|uniref:Major facilitator superfamily (MFS) profile domain-containing protein n=1 Tax=Saxophila tyrrhenica TaxID=1690608 RepID=A0AAV9P8F0_9PEZI|nr:hypothetical protein LTR77_005336 [Saxophila tyrrhenica]
MAEVKPNTAHLEHTTTTSSSTTTPDHGALHDIDQTVPSAALPPGYWRSPRFLGSSLAMALSLLATVSAFGYAAPILGVINADIGPDDNYVWVSLVYTVSLSVSLVIVGRVTDIFGRREFVISFTALGVVGSIVCMTAQNIPVLIGGNVLLGVSTAAGMSFPFLMGELVPIRYRYAASGALYVLLYPGSGFGPMVSQAMIKYHPEVGWRGIYYILLGYEILALILWVTCYFPPTFEQKHGSDKKWDWIKNFDYVGMFLYSAGFVLFLFGLSEGGAVYPWSSPKVISFIVVGFAVLVAFVLWECYMPLKEPFVPMSLFRDLRWTAACVLVGIGAGVYYAFAIVWPTQVATVYASGDPIKDSAISSIIGAAVVAGQVAGGFLTTKIGHVRYQLMCAFGLAGILLGCVAVTTPYNKATTSTLVALGLFATGWNEVLAIATITVALKDQKNIGSAGGVAGGIRMGISAILSAVYTAILGSRLAQTIPNQVPAALVEAGLPTGSVADWIAAYTSGSSTALGGVQGVSDAIIAAGTAAYKEASSDAYRTVFLSTIAINGIGVILTFFVPDPDLDSQEMRDVSAPLHGKGMEAAQEKTLSDDEMA